MQEIRITKEWQLLSDIITLTEGVNYSIQNNSGVSVQFFIGDEAPASDMSTGCLYYQRLLNGIQSTDNLWLKINSTDFVDLVIFEVK